MQPDRGGVIGTVSLRAVQRQTFELVHHGYPHTGVPVRPQALAEQLLQGGGGFWFVHEAACKATKQQKGQAGFDRALKRCKSRDGILPYTPMDMAATARAFLQWVRLGTGVLPRSYHMTARVPPGRRTLAASR